MRKLSAVAGAGAAALGLTMGLGACGGSGSAYAQGEAYVIQQHNKGDVGRALTQQILDETASQNVPAADTGTQRSQWIAGYEHGYYVSRGLAGGYSAAAVAHAVVGQYSDDGTWVVYAVPAGPVSVAANKKTTVHVKLTFSDGTVWNGWASKSPFVGLTGDGTDWGTTTPTAQTVDEGSGSQYLADVGPLNAAGRKTSSTDTSSSPAEINYADALYAFAGKAAQQTWPVSARGDVVKMTTDASTEAADIAGRTSQSTLQADDAAVTADATRLRADLQLSPPAGVRNH